VPILRAGIGMLDIIPNAQAQRRRPQPPPRDAAARKTISRSSSALDQRTASVRLPMEGAVESPNVSVASGICLDEALRQRR
jgi:hypothetical protein